MSNLINTFDQISYKKVFSIAFFMTVLFAVPVGVYMVGQQTRINSRAAYEKPEVNEKNLVTPGPIPSKSPILGRIFPWVGKIGDIVWIQGKNFGVNPESKKLIIGGIEVSDSFIDVWEDDMIQAYIPEGAKQGGVVEIQIGNHPITKSLPYVLYSQNTKVKLIKNGSKISIINGQDVKKVQAWTGDDEIPVEDFSGEVKTNSLGEGEVFDTKNLPILSIILSDKNGQIVSYYVNPVEFGF